MAETLEQQLAGVIAKAIKMATEPLAARIAKLEARGPSLKYCGIFDPGGLYGPGDTVTHQGSLWICKQAVTGGAPHDGSDCWQLCVKRGRDGRDGKDAG